MKILLRYRDNLRPQADPAQKMRLRFFLSNQLRRVWETHFEPKHPRAELPHSTANKLPKPNSPSYFHTVFDRYPTYRFIPLLTHGNKIRCHLSIRYGRWRTGGLARVLDNGDLDARLKVLFDGLSVPQLDQLDFSAIRAEHQANECFVLAEDDRLIESLDVETFEILDAPPGGEQRDEHETVFHIMATLTPFVEIVA
jgi:hypothetical protein